MAGIKAAGWQFNPLVPKEKRSQELRDQYAAQHLDAYGEKQEAAFQNASTILGLGQDEEYVKSLGADENAAMHQVKKLYDDTKAGWDDRGGAVQQMRLESAAQSMNLGDALMLEGEYSYGGGWHNAMNALGGAARGFSNALAADNAAKAAGAQADVENSRLRKGMMDEAGGLLGSANRRNAAQAAAMGDRAVAGASAYERGMQSAGMSGIEGSRNMKRNLDYGMTRAEAQEQMQYGLMDDEALRLEGRMARSFGELSMRKADAVGGAWAGSLAGAAEGLSAGYAKAGGYALNNQVTMQDREFLAERINKLAENLPKEKKPKT